MVPMNRQDAGNGLAAGSVNWRSVQAPTVVT